MADDIPSWVADLRDGDHDRYLATLFAPPERRIALWAIAAFHLEIGRVRDKVREPMMARIRLQWWRDAVASLYGEGEPPPHPLVRALGEAISTYHLTRPPFDAVIDAWEAELDGLPAADLAVLMQQAESLAVPVMRSGLEIMDAALPPAIEAGRLVGGAWHLVTGLLALPRDAARGRVALPMDRLRHERLRIADVAAGRGGESLNTIVAEVAEAARERLRSARALKPQVPVAGIPVLLLGVMAGMHLKTLARAGHDAYAAAARSPHPFRPAVLAWATVRRRYWL